MQRRCSPHLHATYRVSSNPNSRYNSTLTVHRVSLTLKLDRVSLHSEVRRTARLPAQGFTLARPPRSRKIREARYLVDQSTSTSPLKTTRNYARDKRHIGATAARGSASTWKRATDVNARPSRQSGEVKLARHRAFAAAARVASPHSSSPAPPLFPSVRYLPCPVPHLPTA